MGLSEKAARTYCEVEEDAAGFLNLNEGVKRLCERLERTVEEGAVPITKFLLRYSGNNFPQSLAFIDYLTEVGGGIRAFQSKIYAPPS